MQEAVSSKFTQKRKRKQQKTRRRLCLSLCAIVVFITTYLLILPALTEETPVFCGCEEHKHEDACYTLEYVCGAHEHTPECTELSSELVCVLEECEAHAHGEDCYGQLQSLICEQPEVEPHAHGESCMQRVQELICTLPEDETHMHNVTCFVETQSIACGLEETEGHVHNEACYLVEDALLCELPETEGHRHNVTCYLEQSRTVCGFEDGHVHVETCKQSVLSCELTEHTHDLPCYSDPNADLETAEIWEKNLPQELSGIYANDLLAVAKSQLGYHESEKNYLVTEDGVVKGYSRYGAWYGDHYGDWCAMYISFCLEYAQVEGVPYESGCQRWVEALAAQGLYKTDYEPKGGDIVFFDFEGDNSADHVGIVERIDEHIEEVPDESAEEGVREVVVKTLVTIEGNTSNQVARKEYDLENETIMGYCDLPLNEETLVPITATADNGVEIRVMLPIREEDAQSYSLTVARAETDEVLRTLLTEANLPRYAAERYDLTLYKEGEPVALTDELPIVFVGLTQNCAVRQFTGTTLELREYETDGENLTVRTDSLKPIVLSLASFSCHKTEHQHSATCYDFNGDLHCTAQEHLHTAACNKRASDADSESIPGSSNGSTHWHSARYVYYQVSPYYIKKSSMTTGPVMTFVLVPEGTNKTTWVADNRQWCGDGTHNYEVAYCTDIETYIRDGGGANYKRLALEKSPYSASQRTTMKAIVQNSYPFISLEQMVANMAAEGYSVSDGFDQGTAMFSVQWKIWEVANNKTNLEPYSLHDRYKQEVDNTLNPISSARSLNAAKDDLQTVYEYLGHCIAEDVVTPMISSTQRITKITEDSDGTFTIEVEITLSRALTEKDDGTVTLSDDTGKSITVEIPKGQTTFTVALSGVPETAESLHISFDTRLEHGKITAYYYDSSQYQDMIGGRMEESEIEWSDEISLIEETSIQVKKQWVGTVGSQVEATLFANGEALETVILNAANNWSYTWTELPVGTLKQPIVYSVRETPVSGYQTSISGPALGTTADQIYTITNTELSEEESTSVSVEKRWVGTPEGEQPSSITVTLLANGEPYGKTVELNAENEWFYRWLGLPKFDADGNEIVYTIEETPIEGFSSSIESGDPIEQIQSWVLQSSFVSGEEYLLMTSNGALTNASGDSFSWTSVDTATASDVPNSALWVARSSGSGFVLTNKATGLSITQTTSGSIINRTRRFDATESGSTITYTNGYLKAGSYYFGALSSGYGSAASRTSSALAFTLYSLEVQQEGSDVHYILTNTAVEPSQDITLRKTDLDMIERLEGAEFDLYVDDEGETLIPNTNVKGTLLTEDLITDGQGEVLLTGLHKNVTYYLVEVKAPVGYNLLHEPIGFTIGDDDQITIVSGGNMAQGGEMLIVRNKQGYILPETGGVGTYLYTIGGVLLILAGAVLLYHKKREEEA